MGLWTFRFVRLKEVIMSTSKKTIRAPQKRKPGKIAQPVRSGRRRLAPEDRSNQILKGAIKFFAERGFGGQTRELAQQLGITQGLLYRYFPTKDLLIERIYEEMFVNRIDPQWADDFKDRSKPLPDRLESFYQSYSGVLLDSEWGRIYLFSGLEGALIAKRFVNYITNGIFRQVIGELRHEFGSPDLDTVLMTEPELEMMWALHGSIFYIGIRMWVYRVAPPSDIPAAIAQLVRSFYRNAQAMMQVDQETSHDM
jgi:AcrR family transcriptional regulator